MGCLGAARRPDLAWQDVGLVETSRAVDAQLRGSVSAAGRPSRRLVHILVQLFRLLCITRHSRTALPR